LAQKTDIMVHHLPITKARVNLGQVVRRVVRNKEYFILEKDGIPVAGILGAEELEDYLETRNPKAREHIRRSAAERKAGKGRPLVDFLTELDRPAPRRRAKSRKGA
jgi:PHD/YefM family antitoxin component YafN of YafNO toxin-antitoxin module